METSKPLNIAEFEWLGTWALGWLSTEVELVFFPLEMDQLAS